MVPSRLSQWSRMRRWIFGALASASPCRRGGIANGEGGQSSAQDTDVGVRGHDDGLLATHDRVDHDVTFAARRRRGSPAPATSRWSTRSGVPSTSAPSPVGWSAMGIVVPVSPPIPLTSSAWAACRVVRAAGLHHVSERGLVLGEAAGDGDLEIAEPELRSVLVGWRRGRFGIRLGGGASGAARSGGAARAGAPRAAAGGSTAGAIPDPAAPTVPAPPLGDPAAPPPPPALPAADPPAPSVRWPPWPAVPGCPVERPAVPPVGLSGPLPDLPQPNASRRDAEQTAPRPRRNPSGRTMGRIFPIPDPRVTPILEITGWPRDSSRASRSGSPR